MGAPSVFSLSLPLSLLVLFRATLGPCKPVLPLPESPHDGALGVNAERGHIRGLAEVKAARHSIPFVNAFFCFLLLPPSVVPLLNQRTHR